MIKFILRWARFPFGNLRSLLSLCLTIQIVFSPLAQASNDASHYFQRNDSSSSRYENPSTSKSRERVEELLRLADKLDAIPGRGSPQPFELMKLGNQRLEVMVHENEFASYSFNEIQAALPDVVFNSIEIEIDRINNELIFLAMRAGRVVARHHIGQIQISAIARDNEMLSIVDPNGSLHLIDMGLVADWVFRAPIPVIENVWRSPKPFTGQIEARYFSSELTPITEQEISSKESVILRTPQGEPIFTAGDLLVREHFEDGSTRLIGLFSRQKSYARILQAHTFLAKLILLVTPEMLASRKALLEISKLRNGDVDVSLESGARQMTELEANALMAFSDKQIQSIENRFREINGPTQNEIESNPYVVHKKGLSQRNFDMVTLTEWVDQFKKLHFKPPPKSSSPDPEVVFSTKKFWQSRNIQRGLLILGGISAGSVAAYTQFPTEIIESAALVYNNYLPDVLKDTDYRLTLLYSTLSLCALYPAAHYLSKMTGPFLIGLEKMAKDGSLFMGHLRELYQKWAPLEVWARIISFGMRIYALLIYPVWDHVFKRILRQPTFLSAIETDVNPLKRIQAESEIGKKLGLTQDQWVGLNNPFIFEKEKLNQLKAEKMKIHKYLSDKQNQSRAFAWLLATVVVSHESGIDMATLLTLSHSGRLDSIQSLLSDKKQRRIWELTAEGVYQQLMMIDHSTIRSQIENMDSRELAKYIQLANETAQSLKQQSDSEQWLRLLANKFQKGARRLARGVFTFGRSEAEFLNTLFANAFITRQVKKEFRQDHFLSVVIMGLFGDRADLSHPENLAADSKGLLWTSGPHMTDVAYNAWVHFFVSGAKMALVYQSKPPVVESKYEPAEYKDLESAPRVRSFFSTLWNWARVSNQTKADLGGLMWKAMQKRTTTLQASLIMNLVARLIFSESTLVDAVIANFYFYLAAHWYLGWVWDPVQRGIFIQEEQLEEHRERFNDAKYKLSTALRELHSANYSHQLLNNGWHEIQTLYEGYNSKAWIEFTSKHSKVSDNFKTLSLETKKELAIELMAYSKANPPIYTSVNGTATESLILGVAALSTYMGIPIFVNSFDSNYLTLNTLVEWTGISLGLYGMAYLALGAKPWVFYSKQVERISRNLSTKAPKIFKEVRFKRPSQTSTSLSDLLFDGRSCQILFSGN